MSPAILVKAAASILTNEKSRKAVGWVLTAVLSPIILLLAFFCTTFSGGAEHNRTVADLCFHGGAVPEGTPEEYQAYIQEMRDSFALLDAAMQAVEGQMEEGDGLDVTSGSRRCSSLCTSARMTRRPTPGRPLWIALSPMRSAPVR